MNDETIIDNTNPKPKDEARQRTPKREEEKPRQNEASKRQTTSERPSSAVKPKDPKGGKSNVWGAAGIAGAAGLAAGILTPLQVFPQDADDAPAGQEAPAASGHLAGHDMDVATSVDDSMSFNEAFAAAREEVGAGGLFVWHGHTYGTYYADEWNAMSEDDKDQYWADVNHTTSHLNDENFVNGIDEPPIVNPVEDPIATTIGDPDDPNGDEIPSDPPGGWDGQGDTETVKPEDHDPELETEPVETEPLESEILEQEPLESDTVIDPLDFDGDGAQDIVINDVNANEMPDIIIDTDGDGVLDTAIMDVSIAGAADVQGVVVGNDIIHVNGLDDDGSISELEYEPNDDDGSLSMDAPFGIPTDEAASEMPDVDALAENTIDTEIPIDNNMDMGEYV